MNPIHQHMPDGSIFRGNDIAPSPTWPADEPDATENSEMEEAIEQRASDLIDQGYSEDYAWEKAQDELCPQPYTSRDADRDYRRALGDL